MNETLIPKPGTFDPAVPESFVTIDADLAGRLNFFKFKKTKPVEAVQLPFPFAVPTLENRGGAMMFGKIDDWLAKGPAGELYPIDNAIFQDTYVPEEDE